MKETPEQYIARIKGILGSKDPVTILETTPGKLSVLVSGKTEELLRTRPAPAKWSIAEIVAHVAEAEMVLGFRVRMILGENGVPIQAFDQDAWAARYGSIPIALALHTHRAIRQANVALYRSLAGDQWQQFGIHSERGKETIAHILDLHAGHDLNHLSQIEAILAA
jgi:hypothetical protein